MQSLIITHITHHHAVHDIKHLLHALQTTPHCRADINTHTKSIIYKILLYKNSVTILTESHSINQHNHYIAESRTRSSPSCFHTEALQHILQHNNNFITEPVIQ